MEKRILGTRTGLAVSPASIGTMRLPRDHEEAAELVRHAIDAGMTYIDASQGYDDAELKVAKALKGGYRSKVLLSTKWAPWTSVGKAGDETTADFIRGKIDVSLRRLEVDYVDFFQVWFVNNPENYGKMVQKGGMIDGIQKAMNEGVVRHAGFTSHDTVENLLTYLDNADWCSVLLLSYNILNRSYLPVLQKAKEKGIGTIVMNPVHGGKLASRNELLELLPQRQEINTTVELALRYVLSTPCVDTLLCGIVKQSDIDSTVQCANSPPFSDGRFAEIADFLEQRIRQGRICTECGYCMPCPQEVNIPAVLRALCDYRVWKLTESAKRDYGQIGLVPWLPGKNAGACTACGTCGPKCSQHLDIAAEMELAHKDLAV